MSEVTIRARMRARELPGAAIPAGTGCRAGVGAGRRAAGRFGAAFLGAAFLGAAFFGAAFLGAAFFGAAFFGVALLAVGAVRGRGDAPFAPGVRREEDPLPPDRRSVTGTASLRRGW